MDSSDHVSFDSSTSCDENKSMSISPSNSEKSVDLTLNSSSVSSNDRPIKEYSSINNSNLINSKKKKKVVISFVLLVSVVLVVIFIIICVGSLGVYYFTVGMKNDGKIALYYSTNIETGESILGSLKVKKKSKGDPHHHHEETAEEVSFDSNTGVLTIIHYVDESEDYYLEVEEEEDLPKWMCYGYHLICDEEDLENDEYCIRPESESYELEQIEEYRFRRSTESWSRFVKWQPWKVFLTKGGIIGVVALAVTFGAAVTAYKRLAEKTYPHRLIWEEEGIQCERILEKEHGQNHVGKKNICICESSCGPKGKKSKIGDVEMCEDMILEYRNYDFQYSSLDNCRSFGLTDIEKSCIYKGCKGLGFEPEPGCYFNLREDEDDYEPPEEIPGENNEENEI